MPFRSPRELRELTSLHCASNCATTSVERLCGNQRGKSKSSSLADRLRMEFAVLLAVSIMQDLRDVLTGPRLVAGLLAPDKTRRKNCSEPPTVRYTGFDFQPLHFCPAKPKVTDPPSKGATIHSPIEVPTVTLAFGPPRKGRALPLAPTSPRRRLRRGRACPAA